MKERPILFSGPMVRAILDGHKTQTRRVVDLREFQQTDTRGYDFCFRDREMRWHDYRMADLIRSKCPYGAPGDRLWVREKWCYYGGREYEYQRERSAVVYAAAPDSQHRHNHDWRPSIHMPRWASRLTLEVVSVRVERLNEISRGDAMSEGCPFPNMAKGPDPRDWFRELWDSINAAKHPWSSNRWVWVVEFKRIDAAGGDA